MGLSSAFSMSRPLFHPPRSSECCERNSPPRLEAELKEPISPLNSVRWRFASRSTFLAAAKRQSILAREDRALNACLAADDDNSFYVSPFNLCTSSGGSGGSGNEEKSCAVFCPLLVIVFR